MGAWDRIRRAAAGGMEEDEHVRAIDDGMNSLKQHGLLHPGADVRGQPSMSFDTGHRVESVLSPDNGAWTTYVTHDSDPDLRSVIEINHGDLGGQHSRLGEHVVRALRHPDVMGAMRAQMPPEDPAEPYSFRRFDFS
jgi:hypothetical protein